MMLARNGKARPHAADQFNRLTPMLKLRILLALCIASPVHAYACREPFPTDGARLDAADVALVARVSGVQVRALELDSYDDLSDWPQAVLSPRTIRLVVTRHLKGESPKLLALEIENCHGSLDAEVGGSVTAYKIHGEWWLYKTPG
jgi:hypothetical protein